VSRTERSKWRLTFRSLATQAQSALHAADTGPAEQAMELLIDLACEMGDAEYFHSEDPVEAARFVVSHAVSALWQTMLDQHGFAAFAERTARRLIRWESEYGWTRGDGKVAEHETLLAEVLARCSPPRRCGAISRSRTCPRWTPWPGTRPPRRASPPCGDRGDGATVITGARAARGTSRPGTACWSSIWRAPMTPACWTGW
jgi:hypothetical protein